MAKLSRIYVCQSCGATSAQWAGRCGACGEWNSMSEEAVGGPGPQGAVSTAARSGKIVRLESLDAETRDPPRLTLGISELDRVLGGGLVPGSAVLVGGDPGIGKSTLLLQAAAGLAGDGHAVAYLSGEEAAAQVRLRARRLGVAASPIGLGSETNLSNIMATLATGDRPDLVIIDSVQTLWSDALESAPGTVSQLRHCAQALVRYAKQSGAAVVLVGHVTKDGQIAGPKVIEHLVDTVLYFEGDPGHQFRILRARKNRFGPTDEIGVFEMGDAGLREVANPSELFLGDRDAEASGAAVFAGMEGTRPVLVEIQALVAPSPLGTPRRSVVGWDSARLSMLLAVLEARCGLKLGQNDVFLNVAGGLRITEPAADLAAAAALMAAFADKPLPNDTVFFGEASLSGAVRPVSHTELRLKEAHKLGFARAVLPRARTDAKDPGDMQRDTVTRLQELARRVLGP